MHDGHAWHDQDWLHFADEYDTYLLQAAGRLRRRVPESEVVSYLVDIEANLMALGRGPGIEGRAKLVVAAIKADAALWG
ncbi:MAG: hypothetical protein AAFN09_15940 [Pseudomonadota bacterium]